MPVHSGTDWAYAVGHCISITLSISTSAGLRRPPCALIMARAMSRTLTWPFYETRTSRDHAHSG
jgi:hypothetical protein